MMTEFECPNCAGTGEGDYVPLESGEWSLPACEVCHGQGTLTRARAKAFGYQPVVHDEASLKERRSKNT